jgi:multidrug efflux system membrane fusion protein
VPVVVGRATQKDIPVDIQAIGNVEAFSTISVKAQVTGVLTDVKFNEGDYVKKDDELFRIDARPYESALEQAQANLTRDQALLAQAQAQLNRDIANADYVRGQAVRQQQLVERGLISRDLGDQASSAASAANDLVNADKAALEGARAQLAAQQATVKSAQLQLDYTVIRSPITGRTGNLMIKPGNLVSANSTEIITITQVEPVYVTFSIPAVHLGELKQHMADGPLDVAASQQTGDAEPRIGKLTFVDNAVDAATDTIKLKATFANTDRMLWPGQFARVKLRVAVLPNVTTVPAQAVQTGQDGQFVFVVKPDSTVEQRTVTVGQTSDQDVVITAGLRPGETVVTEGQLRLEPGTRIVRADPTTGEAAPTAGRGGRGRGGRGQAGGQGARGQAGVAGDTAGSTPAEAHAPADGQPSGRRGGRGAARQNGSGAE